MLTHELDDETEIKLRDMIVELYPEHDFANNYGPL